MIPYFFVLAKKIGNFLIFFPSHSCQILFGLTLTSVGCVVGPSVNTLKSQLIFPFHTPIFAICLNFQQQQNPLKNQIPSTP